MALDEVIHIFVYARPSQVIYRNVLFFSRKLELYASLGHHLCVGNVPFTHGLPPVYLYRDVLLAYEMKANTDLETFWIAAARIQLFYDVGMQKADRKSELCLLRFLRGKAGLRHLPCLKIQLFFKVSRSFPSLFQRDNYGFCRHVLVCKLRYCGSMTLGSGKTPKVPNSSVSLASGRKNLGILYKFNGQVENNSFVLCHYQSPALKGCCF